jgi:subtilisin family serine protease
MMTTPHPCRALTTGFAALAACSLALLGFLGPASPENTTSVIVRGHDMATAAAAVGAAGGVVTHELGVIDAVGARVRPSQLAGLRRAQGIRRVYGDAPVATAGCGVVAWASPVPNDKKLEWELTNHSRSTVTLSRVENQWPWEHGGLKKAEFAKEKLIDGDPAPAPSVVLEAAGLEDIPLLEPGETGMLKLEFEEKSEAPLSEYSVRVEFAEGCEVEAAGDDEGREANYPAQVGVDKLHELGIDGEGVTIAILDTGYWSHGQIKRGRHGQDRVLAAYDAIKDKKDAKDENGHGTHIASIVVASDKRKDKKKEGIERFAGIAPSASLVAVRAFDEDGAGTYSNVIRGIDWIVQHREEYGIRVLNASFSAPVRSPYWDDPINLAVMKAWKAGIVVVTSAGNTGPDPMSVGVPGNLPYVVTVGAITDNYTPADPGDDRVASFSAAGPTYEGFVKPDVVAPGGHIIGIMEAKSKIAKHHPRFASPYKELFMMSGTSQSTAVVSGIAALMLQGDPSLTPDDVKCGLMATARPAAAPDGTTPYSVFQQGAGLVNAHDAVAGGQTGCANGGLDVALDLAGIQHFGGPATQDETGRFVLLDETGSGTTWDGNWSGSDGYQWSSGYPWSNGYPWANGYPWSDGYPWSNGYPWANGYPWSASLAESASINVWVPQE